MYSLFEKYKVKGNALKIIAVANQKGGVGKTTTAVNIATAFAALNKKTLLIDLDPQGNASTALGVVNKQNRIGSYEVISGSSTFTQCKIQSTVPNLSLSIASTNLAAAELELVERQRREYVLKEACNACQNLFEIIVIDCPPSLGLLTLNALSAAHGVLIPLQCEFLALEGLSQLVKTIFRVKRAFNQKLELNGIVLTMADKRSALSQFVEKDVRSHFGDLVYKSVIPRNSKVSESPSHGQPVLIYDVKSSASIAYMKLTSEILKRQSTNL